MEIWAIAGIVICIVTFVAMTNPADDKQPLGVLAAMSLAAPYLIFVKYHQDPAVWRPVVGTALYLICLLSWIQVYRRIPSQKAPNEQVASEQQGDVRLAKERRG